MHKSSRGFSLLEVLVAFVILGLVLGTLMEIFSGGLRNVTRAAEYQHALLLGQSKLATIGIEVPLKEGESSGEFDSTYRWQSTIKALPDELSQIEEKPAAEKPGGEKPAGENAGGPVAILPVTLMEVDVRVMWGGGEQPRVVSLKTVRLANKDKL